MTRTSIIEKLNLVKDMIAGQKELILVFAFFMILGILLFAFSKKNKSKYLKTFIISYILILIALIAGYNVSLYKLVDYFINNVFYLLVFPNIAVYAGMIITSNILLLTGLLKEKTPKLVKIINVIFYSVIGYMTFLTLDVITKDKIDVYSELDVYSNETLFALLQISMIIFITWIVVRIIIKAVTKFGKKEVVESTVPVIENTSLVEKFVNNAEEIPTPVMNLETSNSENTVYNNITNNTNNIASHSSNLINELPTYKYEAVPNNHLHKSNNIEISFTKEEWMGLNDILKREQNRSNNG